jgi:protein-tyrosine phosphatase
MVDIHSHVLPGLDDGARSLDDSVAMLRMAADAGTTDIVATPHANTEFRWDLAVVEARIAEVQAAAGARVRIHPGCDFHLMFDNINDALAHPAKYTINHKQWLLVEFSDLIIFPNSGDILARLREGGMLPIITHPERNQILRQRFETVERWVGEGSFLQVTAASLTGLFGSAARKYSERLIERGLVHFVASDAHDTSYRTTRLDAAHDWLTDHYGAEYANTMLSDNPRATIEGRSHIESPVPRRRRKWYAPWA